MAESIDYVIAETALRNMLAKGHFCICTIDKVLTLLDRTPDQRAYKRLKPLHCIDYAQMPEELLHELPGLIHECLGGGNELPDLRPMAEETEKPSKPRKFLGLLAR